MALDEKLSSLDLYRWSNPETTCDYPFLAVAQDPGGGAGSVLLSLGNHGLCIDWGIPEEAADWLAHDFTPTGGQISCDLQTVRYVLDALFAGGAEFALVRFDRRLRPVRLQLSLSGQSAAEDGPEYTISGRGGYQRVYREEQRTLAVTLAERALLDVCMELVSTLVADCHPMLVAPPPPRYQRPPGNPFYTRRKQDPGPS